MLYDIIKHGVTQSALMNYLNCRQYAKLSLEGVRPKRPASYFRYGEICHSVLEHVYTLVMGGGITMYPDIEEIEVHVACAVKKYEDKNKLFKNPEDEQIAELQSVMLEVTIYEYFKYWFKEDFKKVKWLEQEREFEFPVNINTLNVPILLRGKRDASYMDGKNICLFETKTKSQIDDNTFYELLALDFQVDLYALSLEYDYKKMPSGCRYNILRRPGQKLGKNESLKAFKDRLTIDVQDRPDHYFVRYKIDLGKKHMEDFKKELRLILTEYFQWVMKEIPTYKNTRSCISRYGTCQYLPICAYGNMTGFHIVKGIHTELTTTR